MAVGDPDDMLVRLKRVLPSRWFADEDPVLDAVLSAAADLWSRLLGAIAEARLQTRLATATGAGLDRFAYDYLGDRVARREGETDARFIIRVRREILRPKVTRAALAEALTDLTGYEPRIFEPALTTDTGGWNTGAFAFGAAGGWGSRLLHHQSFVTAYRPVGEGPPNISGFDEAAGAWGEAGGAFALQSPEDLRRGVTDDDIREAVTSTIAAGTVVWLAIRPWSEAGAARLDIDFVLDVSTLS